MTTDGIRSIVEIEAAPLVLDDAVWIDGNIEKHERHNAGYSIGDRMLSGRALLVAENCGVQLVYRLKDTRPLLAGEIRFWGALLAKLAPVDVDLVSHAPSSGKVPADQHLATLLAQACAAEMGRPFRSIFVNEHKRKNRVSRTAKLEELLTNPYGYNGPGDGSLVLVVDDVVFTRSTARRCAAAAVHGGDRCCFAVLYRA